jgi:hypothetical protein
MWRARSLLNPPRYPWPTPRSTCYSRLVPGTSNAEYAAMVAGSPMNVMPPIIALIALVFVVPLGVCACPQHESGAANSVARPMSTSTQKAAATRHCAYCGTPACCCGTGCDPDRGCSTANCGCAGGRTREVPLPVAVTPSSPPDNGAIQSCACISDHLQIVDVRQTHDAPPCGTGAPRLYLLNLSLRA